MLAADHRWTPPHQLPCKPRHLASQRQGDGEGWYFFWNKSEQTVQRYWCGETSHDEKPKALSADDIQFVRLKVSEGRFGETE